MKRYPYHLNWMLWLFLFVGFSSLVTASNGFHIVQIVPPAIVLGGTVMVTRHFRRLEKNREKRRNGECDHCGYNLTGNVSGVCPECGHRIRDKKYIR